MKSDVVAAHKHSSMHRTEVEASDVCGCFHCLAVFSPDAIEEWVDFSPTHGDNGEIGLGCTALCPRCGIDSVIGAASGYTVTRDFLGQMKKHWF